MRRNRGKRTMKQVSVLACLAIGLSAAGTAAAQAQCRDTTIAAMNWQSAQALASVDKFILEKGYGCTVSIISGDTVPTLTSMAEKGQPDVAPEGWVDLVPEVMKRGLAEKRLVVAGDAISDGALQGWFVPKYIIDANPGIKTIADALRRPDLFPAPEDPSKGAVFNGPQGWGGTVVTTQLFKAYGGQKAGFTLVDTGSAAGLDGSIARANERKTGWLGYYWSPTSILGRYEMVRLDFGVPHDAAEWARCNAKADCPDPKPNAWSTDRVQTLVTAKYAERAGQPVMDYFKARSWSNATVNKLLAWMTANQAVGEDGAKHFLRSQKEIWTKWVSPEAAKKIQAAL